VSTALARRTAQNITLHYFLTNMGLFGLLSTLVVALTAARYSPTQTGVLVLVFTIANKVAKVPLARWLNRVPPPSSVLLGCLIAAAGFTGLQLVNGMGLTATALASAGLGVSINALASKQLAAEASDRTHSRARLFSLINVAVNLASAAAAPIALFFVNRHHHDYVLTAVSVVYCVAGVTTFLNYARMRLPAPATAGTPLSGYRAVLALPGMRSFLLVNFFGWLCYGQLFNALAVYVSAVLRAPDRLGWLYTLNALLIVATQLGVTRLAEWGSGGRPAVVAVAAYTMFGASFASILLVAGYPGAVLAVVLFTLAEMLFVPTMDVLLLGLLGQGSRAIGYAMFSIANALGEGVGGGVGVAVYRSASESGHGSWFWLAASAAAMVFALVTHRRREAITPARPVPRRAGRHRATRPPAGIGYPTTVPLPRSHR
jgi:DHA1 family multidrug resistance protein-like MFS transporter